jgi:hypothetical protein
LRRFSAPRQLPNLVFIFEGQLLGSNVNAECVGRLYGLDSGIETEASCFKFAKIDFN